MSSIFNCLPRSKTSDNSHAPIDKSKPFINESNRILSEMFKKELEEEPKQDPSAKNQKKSLANSNVIVLSASPKKPKDNLVISLPCLHLNASKHLKVKKDSGEIIKKLDNRKTSKTPYGKCTSCKTPIVEEISPNEVTKLSVDYARNSEKEMSERLAVLERMGTQGFIHLTRESLSLSDTQLSNITSHTIRDKLRQISEEDWSKLMEELGPQLEKIKSIMILPDIASDIFLLQKNYDPKKNASSFKLFPQYKRSAISSIEFSYAENISQHIRKKNKLKKEITTKVANLKIKLTIPDLSVRKEFESHLIKAISSSNVTITNSRWSSSLNITEIFRISVENLNYKKNIVQSPGIYRLIAMLNLTHNLPFCVYNSLLLIANTGNMKSISSCREANADEELSEKEESDEKSEKEQESEIIERSSSSSLSSSSSSSSLTETPSKIHSSLSIPSPSKNFEQECKKKDEEIELQTPSDLVSSSSSSSFIESLMIPVKTPSSPSHLSIPSPSLLSVSRPSNLSISRFSDLSIPRPSDLNIKNVEEEEEEGEPSSLSGSKRKPELRKEESEMYVT